MHTYKLKEGALETGCCKGKGQEKKCTEHVGGVMHLELCKPILHHHSLPPALPSLYPIFHALLCS